MIAIRIVVEDTASPALARVHDFLASDQAQHPFYQEVKT